jgi:hypothetical protein
LKTSKEILIDRIESDVVDGRARVSAEVLGTSIWFESSDVRLQPRAEVFACALLIPSLHSGARLRFSRPIDSVWQSNCLKLMTVLNEWWQYPQLPPAGPTEQSHQIAGRKRTALCFSGGVDSFYTLLHSGEEIDDLVTVFGFDMEFEDTTRATSVEKSVRDVAAKLDKRAIFVRTNLRAHPLVNSVSWERSHGGAMAAIGFLLSSDISRLFISSSIDRSENRPWGSHWELDPWWSSSDLSILNLGSELRRYEKLTVIAAEPILRDHLRVCWENRVPVGNCSCCLKCLNTRIVLADCGVLDHYSVFQGSETLITDLRETPSAEDRMKALSEIAVRRRLSAEILVEVDALIERSTTSSKRKYSAQAKGWEKVRKWIDRIYLGR